MTAGYSGKPLVEKLGVKLDSTLVLIGALEGAERLLGPLPPEVKLRHGNRGRCEMTIWSTRPGPACASPGAARKIAP